MNPSEKPNNPLYGRRWSIGVGKKEILGEMGLAWDISDSDWSNEALRCTFSIEKAFNHVPWYADLTIWNLAGDTERAIIDSVNLGSTVVIEAGYQSGNYGTIWDGEIFQPLFDREDGTDFKLTLHCMNGLGIMISNFCAKTLTKGHDYAGILKEIAKSSRNPIPVGSISQSLHSQKLPRGKVIFGEPKKYIRQMTQDKNCQWFFGEEGLSVFNINEPLPHEDKATVVSPKTGLIGTPQQTQGGIIIRTLLNPLLIIRNPAMVVKVDNSVIRQTKIDVGQLVSPLDQDGYYKIIKVRHIGDTRGNDWYTEITCVSLLWPVPLGSYVN